MNISHSHHPAIRLFMIVLVSGSGILVMATVGFVLLERLMNPDKNTDTDITLINAATNINTNTPVVDLVATDLLGIVEQVETDAVTIRLQGYNQYTRESVLRIVTNSDTNYAVVDTRTPPPPGGGVSVTAHETTRSSLSIGATVSVLLNNASTAYIAQTLTIIE